MIDKRRRLGQFYTPAEVARTLIERVGAKPASVLDLGCGHGALAKAAVAAWGWDLELVTVDVDPEAGPLTGQGWSAHHRHFVRDLLASVDADLPGSGEYDLVVLNPPYGRMPSSSSVSPAPPASRVRPWRCRPTAFLLRALSTVRLGGTVAAIVPETLARGAGYSSNRKAVTEVAAVDSISLLPAGTFVGTEARTVLLLLTRVAKREGSPIPWRGDVTEVSTAGGCGRTIPIRDLDVSVVRGRMCTVEARTRNAFHLDNFSLAADGRIKLPHRATCNDDRAAREGDILIARVGRRISEKVVLVTSGSTPISDCIYRLRCPPRVVHRVWNGLRSDEGRRQVEDCLSGVTTRLLPLGALMGVHV